MTQKSITVFGATDAQDGGLIRVIHQDSTGEFAVRTLTRHASSTLVQKWTLCGAKVVEVYLGDAASIRRVMQGAYEAYCVTFFWKYFSPEKELAEACTLAEPTKSDGVRHVIWSALEESRQWVPLFNNRVSTLMCKYKVSSFDAKGEGNHFSIALGVTTTFLLTSFYWENFSRFGMSPKPGPDCHLAITFPMGDGQLFGMAAENTGWCSLDIFKQRTALIGNTMGITDRKHRGHHRRAAHEPGNGCRPEQSLGLPRCRRPGQYVSVSAQFRR